MGRVKCALKKRGKPSIEFYKNSKPQYYCMGWIDCMTDDLLPECRSCPDHVDKAQDDLDKYLEEKDGTNIISE